MKSRGGSADRGWTDGSEETKRPSTEDKRTSGSSWRAKTRRAFNRDSDGSSAHSNRPSGGSGTGIGAGVGERPESSSYRPPLRQQQQQQRPQPAPALVAAPAENPDVSVYFRIGH